MTGVVDRIEGEIAVVEWDDGGTAELRAEAFEGGVLPKERDVVASDAEGTPLRVDAGETARRIEAAEKRMRGLFGRRSRGK